MSNGNEYQNLKKEKKWMHKCEAEDVLIEILENINHI